MLRHAAVRQLAVGDPLPQLHGEFLTGRRARLPQVAAGRFALLLLGFTYESRFAVEAWAGNFQQQFAGDPRATFYEIPMIGGMARLAKWFIDNGMRRGTPHDDYEHVITVYGGTALWKQRVGFGDPEAAYLILLDSRGIVAWLHNGGFDNLAYRSLVATINNGMAG